MLHVMRLLRLICFCFMLAILAGTASAQTIYAIGVGPNRGPVTTVRVDEHFWVITSQSGWYGLFQFSDRAGADAPWVRRTSVHFGSHKFTVRLSATTTAAVTILAALCVVMLAVTLTGGVRRVHRLANTA
jgi:hypothetical protein